MRSNDDNVEIELLHIELELKIGRAQHFRHFVDQYYCYRHGYVTSGGRAKWEALLRTGVVSAAALDERERKRLVREHAVPLKVITDHLLRLVDAGPLSIAATIDKYFIVGLITKEEDQQLRRLNLSNRMPMEYFERGHLLHGNLLARYHAADITLAQTPSHVFKPSAEEVFLSSQPLRASGSVTRR